MLNSRINSWESWFIFHLQKININQYWKSGLCTWIIIIRHRYYAAIIFDNYFYGHNYTIIALYILERPSAWSTSRIRPAWPLFRDELNLLLAFFHKCLPCLFWPNQYLAACFNGSHFTLNPPFPAGQLNTIIQVNNTATPHHMYTDTHIYITFKVLSILFFTLLLLGKPAGSDSYRLTHLQHSYFVTKLLCSRRMHCM